MNLTSLKFPRVYHQWQQWEEIKHNMWGQVSDRQKHLDQAIQFTGNHKKYGAYMMRVVTEWPISCENALTDERLSKRAWVGHAACALALGCPEDIVRQAWGYLTDEQRLLANREAERAIRHWRTNYAKSKGLLPDLERQMLLEWNTR